MPTPREKVQHNTFIILRVRPALLSRRTIAVLLAGSGRRFIPEFTICLAEMRPRGGGTTLTQHLIATTVALLLICICLNFFFADLQISAWLPDGICCAQAMQLLLLGHHEMQKQKSSMSSCVQSCKGKLCTFKSAAAFCWSLSAEDRGTTAHARPLWGRSDSSAAH